MDHAGREAHGFVRRWRRLDRPAWPFVWRGLLPALGLLALLLFAVGPFARGWIEEAVARNVRATLDAAGMGWAEVAVSGQEVRLAGAPPAEADGERALALARQARGPSWLGRLVCPTVVASAFGAPAAWQDVRAVLEKGVLTLTGQVPSEADRQALAAAARARLGPPRLAEIRDQLTLANRPAPAAWAPLALRAAEVAARCTRGVASLSAGVFSASCLVARSDLEPLRATALSPVEGGRIGTVELVEAEAATACEDRLASRLARSRIAFATGSAALEASAFPLLDQVAAEARACPGRLVVEGHTDSVGVPAHNMALSQARAEAVRQALLARGIPADRLGAQGFGQTRPLSSNDDPAGRARNRRIEVRVVTGQR